MSTPSHTQLAEQYLEMWQQQMSAALTDKTLVERWIALMGALPQQGGGHEQAPHPAAAPDAVLERLEQLDYRVRMLERRFAGHTPRAKQTRKKARKTPA